MIQQWTTNCKDHQACKMALYFWSFSISLIGSPVNLEMVVTPMLSASIAFATSIFSAFLPFSSPIWMPFSVASSSF
jgi:hypothetical protein